MSNKKKSSIEWYAEQFAEHIEENYGIKITSLTLLNKAKAMREKEIKDAFDAGEKNVLDQYSNPMTKVITSEQYYNETFNNN